MDDLHKEINPEKIAPVSSDVAVNSTKASEVPAAK